MFVQAVHLRDVQRQIHIAHVLEVVFQLVIDIQAEPGLIQVHQQRGFAVIGVQPIQVVQEMAPDPPDVRMEFGILLPVQDRTMELPPLIVRIVGFPVFGVRDVHLGELCPIVGIYAEHLQAVIIAVDQDIMHGMPVPFQRTDIIMIHKIVYVLPVIQKAFEDAGHILPTYQLLRHDDRLVQRPIHISLIPVHVQADPCPLVLTVAVCMPLDELAVDPLPQSDLATDDCQRKRIIVVRGDDRCGYVKFHGHPPPHWPHWLLVPIALAGTPCQRAPSGIRSCL